MNSLSFDDPSLDNLDPTLSLNDPSDIDTALLSDIDGKSIYLVAVGWNQSRLAFAKGNWRWLLLSVCFTSQFDWSSVFYI